MPYSLDVTDTRTGVTLSFPYHAEAFAQLQGARCYAQSLRRGYPAGRVTTELAQIELAHQPCCITDCQGYRPSGYPCRCACHYLTWDADAPQILDRLGLPRLAARLSAVKP